MATFGWNMDRLKILDATPDVRAHKRQRSVIDVGTSLDVRDMEDVTDIRQSSQVRALEVTVHSVQKMIKQEFSQHLERTKQRYKRIAVDSMTALKMFSMEGQDSRILIQSFLRFLAELEATTLIVSERLDRRKLETEFFLGRGEIRMHKWIDGSMIRRALSIEKFRGSAFDDKMHPVTIGDKGMVVALDPPSQIRGTSPEGKPGESLLETRLIDEVSNVIESVMRQIEEAHRRQIPIRDVEVALSRDMLACQRRNYQNELKINMRAFRWNLDDLDVLDANSDIRRFEPTPLLEISTEEEPAKMRSIGERIRKTPDFESKEVSVHSLQQLLKTLLVKKHYERVVIDSITALRYFCMREFEEAVTTQSFMRYLAESKVTSLLTVELPGEDEVLAESFLARGEVRLHKLRDETGIKRFVSVEKYKGSSHDDAVYSFDITNAGIVINMTPRAPVAS